MLNHLKRLTSLLRRLRRYAYLCSGSTWGKRRREFHLIFLYLLLFYYLLQMVLYLTFRRTASWDSIERTLLCLEISVSLIVSWHFANRIWVDSRDSFVIAVTTHFLLLELQHVCLKRWYKFLRRWILFIKANIGPTSLSRRWIFLLYLL